MGLGDPASTSVHQLAPYLGHNAPGASVQAPSALLFQLLLLVCLFVCWLCLRFVVVVDVLDLFILCL